MSTLFVGNVSRDATEDQLRALFAGCGQVVSYRLVMDKDTGKGKGAYSCARRVARA